MKYILKVFKGCDIRYIPVSESIFRKFSATCWLAGNEYYKCVRFDELDLDLQKFVMNFF